MATVDGKDTMQCDSTIEYTSGRGVGRIEIQNTSDWFTQSQHTDKSRGTKWDLVMLS